MDYEACRYICIGAVAIASIVFVAILWACCIVGARADRRKYRDN